MRSRPWRVLSWKSPFHGRTTSKYQTMTFFQSSVPLRLSCHFKCMFRMCLKCIDMIRQHINNIHSSNTWPHGKTILQDTTLGPETSAISKSINNPAASKILRKPWGQVQPPLWHCTNVCPFHRHNWLPDMMVSKQLSGSHLLLGVY